MQSHKDLIVWQKSILFAKEIYLATKKFPSEERFGLSFQLQRAAVSIPSNIAEGYGRGAKREIIHFLTIASGSASEIETQLIICESIGFIEKELFLQLEKDIIYIRKMLSSLITSVKKQLEEPQPNN